MKKDKYIIRDERGGFKVAKVNLSLPDERLRLFLEGKEDWLEEGLLVPAKKNEREGL
jgi:predicted metal-dependent hydrolase